MVTRYLKLLGYGISTAIAPGDTKTYTLFVPSAAGPGLVEFSFFSDFFLRISRWNFCHAFVLF
jgi:hypothetical protein